MTDARQQEGWNHTATMLAMLANVNRDPRKGRPFKPADFHPILSTKCPSGPPLKGDIQMLKTIFVDGRKNL
jgi:hypothetical protein